MGLLNHVNAVRIVGGLDAGQKKGQATGFETDLALTTAIMVGTKGTRRWR